MQRWTLFRWLTSRGKWQLQALGLVMLMSLQTPAVSSEHIIDNDTLQLTMHTTVGNITIELFVKQAPISSANFLRYVKAGAYNQGEIYRVVREDNDNGSPKITAIQGGANPDFADFAAIALETTETTGIRHLNGTLSMARGEPNTATSAFFICIDDQPSLDFGGQRNPDGLGFAAFGRVIQGMGVVRNINNIDDTKEVEDDYVKGQILRQPIVIQGISLH